MIPIMVPAETQKSRGGVYGTEKEEMRGNRREASNNTVTEMEENLI